MKREILKMLGVVVLCFLAGMPSLKAQEVWPGDVNNNGIVNNIDVLYWALAKDASGPARAEVNSEWTAQPIGELWGQAFPDGLNFAYADCDGDGAVTDDDRAVITANYRRLHGLVSADEYFLGNAGEDPVLKLQAADPLTEPGLDEEVLLSLGEEGDSIYNFFGIAFVVKFDTDNIKDSPGSSNQNFSFAFTPDSWIDGQGTQMAKEFLFVDDENGVAEMAIYRKNAADPVPSGAGAIGKFTIVMEDIIVGLVELNTDSIRLIDNQLESVKIASSNTNLAQDSLLLNSRGALPGKDEILVYPNPATNWITIELKSTAANAGIQKVSLFTMSGQLIDSLSASRPAAKAMASLNGLPQGLYLLKIETDRGIFLRKAVKMPR